MKLLSIIQFILILFLVDRNLFIRDRYKIGIELSHRSFAIWIYNKKPQAEFYTRDGGKRLLFFRFGKQKKL